MLVLSEAIGGRNVMSIHAGGAIAKTSEAIIDPANLKIIAFSVLARGLQYFSVIHCSDIREWSPIGVVINSEDDLMEVDENMPKIRELIESKFKLDGIGVRTESGKRLGRVKNFVFETDGYFVVKFYIERSGPFNLFNQPLVIERDSVVNVTNKFIVVSDDKSKVKAKASKVKEEVEYGFSGS